MSFIVDRVTTVEVHEIIYVQYCIALFSMSVTEQLANKSGSTIIYPVSTVFWRIFVSAAPGFSSSTGLNKIMLYFIFRYECQGWCREEPECQAASFSFVVTKNCLWNFVGLVVVTREKAWVY